MINQNPDQYSKTVLRYNYTGFYVFRIWINGGTKEIPDYFKFINGNKVHDSTIAGYYKGGLEVVDTNNPSLLGYVYSGWQDCIEHPEWNSPDEWQTVNLYNNVEWWCFHSENHNVKSLEYVPVTSEFTVNPGLSMLVFSGSVTVNDSGNIFVAEEMNHVKPRPYAYTANGDAKVLLLTYK
jgi:hypothetical protein